MQATEVAVTDGFNKPINIGDKIIYIQKFSSNFVLAEVVKFIPHKEKSEYIEKLEVKPLKMAGFGKLPEKNTKILAINALRYDG